MIHLCSSNIVAEILDWCMCKKLGNGGILVGLNYERYDDLFHLECLWTLVLIGVGSSIIIYEGFICNLLVIFSNFGLRFGAFIVVFL